MFKFDLEKDLKDISIEDLFDLLVDIINEICNKTVYDILKQSYSQKEKENENN